MLDRRVWITIGFTYDAKERKYYQIKDRYDNCGFCLACTRYLNTYTTCFCWNCKVPTLPDWTTGIKSLDSIIMKTWFDMKKSSDNHIQWIEFSQLTNIQEILILQNGCTHIADWLVNQRSILAVKPRLAILKKIIDG